MDGDQHWRHRLECFDLAAAAQDGLRRPGEAQCSGAAEGDNEPGPYQRDFLLDPPAAVTHFRPAWALVQAQLATRLVLEVLYRIREVCGGPVDAGSLQSTVEQRTGRTNERPAGQIFLVSRLLADQH